MSFEVGDHLPSADLARDNLRHQPASASAAAASGFGQLVTAGAYRVVAVAAYHIVGDAP